MNRYVWKEKKSSRGNTYYEVEDLMAFHNQYLYLAFYIYPTKELAEANEKIGASGFIASVTSPEGNRYLYAVTNAHVIEGIKDKGVLKCALRFNTKDYHTDIIEADIDGWYLHPNNDDIAVYPLEPASNWKYSYIADYQMLKPRFVYGKFHDEEQTRDILEQTSHEANELIHHVKKEIVKVGLGDETITIGRYMKHSGGKDYNLPAMRFGHISMLPFEDEPIPQNRPSFPSHPQISFLEETYSINGFSGSPVLVRPEIVENHWTFSKDEPPQLKVDPEETTRGIFLLGIDWGHFDFNGELIDHSSRSTAVKIPSGMMCVVPAWKLLDILHGVTLTMQRKELDNERAKKAKSDNSASIDGDISKEEFEAVLKKVSRKTDRGGTIDKHKQK